MMYEIMTPAEAKALGGLTLAFFGDSVYEVYVREQCLLTSSTKKLCNM